MPKLLSVLDASQSTADECGNERQEPIEKEAKQIQCSLSLGRRLLAMDYGLRAATSDSQKNKQIANNEAPGIPYVYELDADLCGLEIKKRTGIIVTPGRASSKVAVDDAVLEIEGRKLQDYSKKELDEILSTPGIQTSVRCRSAGTFIRQDSTGAMVVTISRSKRKLGLGFVTEATPLTLSESANAFLKSEMVLVKHATFAELQNYLSSEHSFPKQLVFREMDSQSNSGDEDDSSVADVTACEKKKKMASAVVDLCSSSSDSEESDCLVGVGHRKGSSRQTSTTVECTSETASSSSEVPPEQPLSPAGLPKGNLKVCNDTKGTDKERMEDRMRASLSEASKLLSDKKRRTGDIPPDSKNKKQKSDPAQSTAVRARKFSWKDGPKKQKTKVKSEFSPVTSLRVGQRVVCEWTDKLMYGGHITHIFNRKMKELYNVLFWDGDKLDRIPRKKVFPLEEYLGMKLPGPGQNAIRNDWKAFSSGNRCGKCYQCNRKRPCGTCINCSRPDDCIYQCIRRMCCRNSNMKVYTTIPLLPDCHGVAFTPKQDLSLMTGDGKVIVGNDVHELILTRFGGDPKLFQKFYELVGMGKDQTRIEPGCRCYAKAMNGSFYYGTIATVTVADGSCKAGQILFDDTEVHHCSNFTDESMCEVLFTTTYEERDCQSDLRNFRKRRCKTCPNCRKQVCTKCIGCKENMKSSGLYKMECIMTICNKIPSHERQLGVPGIPGYSFYAAGNQIRVISPEGCSVSKMYQYHEAKRFYDVILGRPRQQSIATHKFIGKGVKHRWVEVDGGMEEMSGTVTGCVQCEFSKEHTFTVRYDEPFDSNRTDFPKTASGIDEEDIQYLIGAYENDWNPNWICPTKVVLDKARRTMVLRAKSCVLEVKVEQSKIPGAGLGVFIRCTKAPEKSGGRFLLNKGERVDLGKYGPIVPGDYFDEHTLLVNTFLTSSKNESWTFHTPNSGVIDIIDPVTSKVREEYQDNVLIYVNEVAKAGTDITVVCAHDPTGAVHYFLNSGLELPVSNQWTELKIDYGERYERVRVREGYSRVSKAEQTKLQHEIDNDDRMTLSDIMKWSAKEAMDCLRYLDERIFDGTNLFTTVTAARALTLTLSFIHMLATVKKQIDSRESDDISYCDNGISDVTESHFRRYHSLLQRIVTSTGCEPLEVVAAMRELTCFTWIKEAVLSGASVSDKTSDRLLLDIILRFGLDPTSSEMRRSTRNKPVGDEGLPGFICIE